MATPVVVVPSGGLPITVVASGGLPMEIASNGRGIAVTVVTSRGLPVTGVSTGPDVTAPIITSASAISQPENTALTHYLMANEPVTWAKVGGVDSAKFTLGSGATAGQLTLPAKDYELPDDSNADRAYVVQVQATDAASNASAIQTITVTITDIDENLPGTGPTISLLPISDTGSSSTDFITNDTLPTWHYNFTSASAVAGDSLQTYVDAVLYSTVVLTGPQISSGADIDMAGTPLTTGPHAIKARINRVVGGPTSYGNTVTITIDTTAPTITSSGTVSQAENAVLNHALTANETVTWTKTGGADAAKFTLTGSTLTLPAKDYEAPDDADTNRSYIVQVTATDVAGNTANQTITVTITDVVDTAAGFAHVAHTFASGDATGATTGAINTTGANLIVVSVNTLGAAGVVTVTDSKGNTWTALAVRGSAIFIQHFYCVNPTVGTGHTFTGAGSSGSDYASMAVSAFSGAHASPFDSQAGGFGTGGTTASTSGFTPSQANCVVVFGIGCAPGPNPTTVSGGFTVMDTSPGIGGTAWGGGHAYLIQTIAVAANPVWTFDAVVGDWMASLVAFRAA